MEPPREEARLPALALIVRGLQLARQQYRRMTVMLLAGEWTCMAASVRTASVQVSKAERQCAALAPAPTPAPHGAARDERRSRWSNGGTIADCAASSSAAAVAVGGCRCWGGASWLQRQRGSAHGPSIAFVIYLSYRSIDSGTAIQRSVSVVWVVLKYLLRFPE